MNTVNRSPIRRLLIVLSAVATTAAFLTNPASAEPNPVNVCNSGSGFVMCFSLDRIQLGGDINVHLGIDVAMSREEAQAIIDHPGDEFSAKVIGEDPAFDNSLVSVPVTWSAAGDNGLSAEFDMVATWSQLNEDDGFFDGYIDDLFGRIVLAKPNGEKRTFNSITIHGYY
ncbi:hypothetical protein [Nonomuraea sp. JJY05]|jgi:hypothetical protein|uniref:hypothetical protein n=1 Tax=Nonomuraea sp. JJY05 TaxID=3350255 RepID=UPI00373ED708